ncbi:hypothetical protein BD309DRAFT_952692 [Dichomitus squalens]|nr:hypothetical protein BD309DRAFT_952692 [Dichomitus squalens]
MISYVSCAPTTFPVILHQLLTSEFLKIVLYRCATYSQQDTSSYFPLDCDGFGHSSLQDTTLRSLCGRMRFRQVVQTRLHNVFSTMKRFARRRGTTQVSCVGAKMRVECTSKKNPNTVLCKNDCSAKRAKSCLPLFAHPGKRLQCRKPLCSMVDFPATNLPDIFRRSSFGGKEYPRAFL